MRERIWYRSVFFCVARFACCACFLSFAPWANSHLSSPPSFVLPSPSLLSAFSWEVVGTGVAVAKSTCAQEISDCRLCPSLAIRIPPSNEHFHGNENIAVLDTTMAPQTRCKLRVALGKWCSSLSSSRGASAPHWSSPFPGLPRGIIISLIFLGSLIRSHVHFYCCSLSCL